MKMSGSAYSITAVKQSQALIQVLICPIMNVSLVGYREPVTHWRNPHIGFAVTVSHIADLQSSPVGSMFGETDTIQPISFTPCVTIVF